MKFKIILFFILILLVHVVISQDCNTLCLNSGYSYGSCTDKCTDIKIKGGSDCASSGNAALIIGTEASKEYTNLERFIGENSSSPKWVWVIKNMKTKSSTKIGSTTDDSSHSGPIIGLKNNFIANSLSSLPIPAKGVGSSFCFPNDVICVNFQDLTATNYSKYTIQKTTVDLSSFNSSWTNKNTISITSDEKDGLKLDTADYDLAIASSGIKTDTIWVIYNNTASYAGIFYRDTSNNGKKAAGFLNMNSNDSDKNIADINYQDTKDNNVQIDLRGNFGSANGLSLVLDITAKDGAVSVNSADDIKINLKHSSNSDFEGYGNTSASADDSDLVWASTDIGTKTIDLRSLYGIIIKDPKTNNALDKVILEIPDSQVKAKIEILRKESQLTKTSISNLLSEGEKIPQPILGKELSSKEDYNLILVGGPCANPIIEKFSEFPKCKTWPFKEGESIVSYTQNGKNTALLIAGTTEDDTKAAVDFLNGFKQYDLKGVYIKLINGQPIVISDISSEPDISDFPYPFLKGGQVQNMQIIIGEKASIKDINSAHDININLMWLNRNSSTNTTTTTENINLNNYSVDIPLGSNLADTNFFNPSLSYNYIPTLIKNQLSFLNKYIPYHEEIMLYNSGPTIATSLSSSDDTYKSDVYMELNSGSLRYYYVFDDNIDIASATVDSPLTINFLDNQISITNIDVENKFKTELGSKYLLNIGEEITVSGIDIKLVDTTKDGAIVLSVNNSNEIFDKGQSKYVNGLIIKDSEAFKQANNQCCCTDLLKFL